MPSESMPSEVSLVAYKEELLQCFASVKDSVVTVLKLIKQAPAMYTEAKTVPDEVVDIIYKELIESKLIPWFVPNVLVKKVLSSMVRKLLKV